MSAEADRDIQDLARDHVRAYFSLMQKKNSSFSLRALGLKLDVPPSNLALFMSGKRNFSEDTLKRVVRITIDNPEERKIILARLNEKHILKKKKAKKGTPSKLESLAFLSEAEFLQMNEWYFYSIRTLLSLKDAPRNSEEIGRILNLPFTKVEAAINLMLKLGLLQLNNGVIERTSKHIATPDSDKRSPKVSDLKVKIHEAHIQHALRSLNHHDTNLRDITWVNIPANPARLQEAREIIRKCQDDLLTILEDKDATTPYRLTIQLVPMSLG